MNSTQKFHKANGPAFAVGERWVSSCDNWVTILSVEKFGDGKWDYEVTYSQVNAPNHSKDSWNFQVRYQHQADLNLKVPGQSR